jgi:hypothetical protein
MLGGVDQHEGHRQRVSHQQRAPPRPDTAPQEHRDHRGHCGVQGGNRRDEINAGLSRVDQCSGRLQMQGSPAASRDPLNEEVGAGLASVHAAQQSAVRNTCGTSEHAARIGGAAGDIGRRAAGGCPRRCGRRNNVHDQGGERQRDETPDKGCPVVSVTQPKHPRDQIGQDEKRHVDAADDHFPPRGLRHLNALLQPHRGDGAEEQPSIGLGLKLPKRGRSEHCCRAAAEVIERQHERKRKPIAHNPQHLVPATDAGGDEPGGDVEQQQFAVECEPVRQRPVGHHKGPGSDRHPPREREPSLAVIADIKVDVDERFGVRQRHHRRPLHPAEQPSGCRLPVALEGPDSAIGCY